MESSRYRHGTGSFSGIAGRYFSGIAAINLILNQGSVPAVNLSPDKRVMGVYTYLHFGRKKAKAVLSPKLNPTRYVRGSGLTADVCVLACVLVGIVVMVMKVFWS